MKTKSNALAAYARAHGHIPLSWAGSTSTMDYLNIGDALSPVMVSLLSGMDVQRIPSKSQSLRMGCVGTIGHGFAGGEVWFWGAGASPYENPSASADERKAFTVPDGSNFVVTATRGPLSEALLTGKAHSTVGVYGDPVWLLPRFYAPAIPKRWKLGVIVHLSELADRDPEAHVKEELTRYRIPESLRNDVHIINTVSAISLDAIKDKIDEILACERIISTSLHGIVFAESYGIPCLHFPRNASRSGLDTRDLDANPDLDLRFVDLYRGLKLKTLPVYNQMPERETDWDRLILEIDRVWEPKTLDEDALIAAFPLDVAPLEAPAGGTIWDHPTLKGLVLQHDVGELGRIDRLRTKRSRTSQPKSGKLRRLLSKAFARA